MSNFVQVNGSSWQLASCTCVPWSRSSRRKLSNVSNSLENIAHRTRDLQYASLEETIPYLRYEHAKAADKANLAHNTVVCIKHRSADCVSTKLCFSQHAGIILKSHSAILAMQVQWKKLYSRPS